MLLTPAQINQNRLNRDGPFLFYPGWMRLICLRACLGTRLLPQSYQYPNLSEGADRISGQLRGDKECPFSGVTKHGRVWRKVLESDAWSMGNLVFYALSAITVISGQVVILIIMGG